MSKSPTPVEPIEPIEPIEPLTAVVAMTSQAAAFPRLPGPATLDAALEREVGKAL